MVKNLWNETEYSQISDLLDQRVYSSRLLGQDADLVMHGGGNTSVKGEVTDLLGRKKKVLYVKGSGWDLASIERPGYPAVTLEPLLELRELSTLGDPEMVNVLRTLLIDCQSPDPSVETLLHAFLPHRFIDHTHADAILTLTNQPDGEQKIRDLYGSRVGIVPYVMPGFQLAKLCTEVFERDPKVEGLVLLNHGIFTFGDSAKQSYDRMVQLVKEAEEWIVSRTAPPAALPPVPKSPYKMLWAQMIRKQLLQRKFRPLVECDDSDEIIRFLEMPDAQQSCGRGPLTPDHVIRTKQLPLFVPAADSLSSDPAAIDQLLSRLLDEYRRNYTAYFTKNCEEKRVERQMLDPLPRVFLVPRVGLFTVGASTKEAKIAMDIYQHTLRVIKNGNEIGAYEALGDGDLFDVEYWVLEQAKLKLGPKKMPLSGKIAVITGAASGIGLAIAREFLLQGANVHVLDIQDEKFSQVTKVLQPLAKSGNKFYCHKTNVAQRNDMSRTIGEIIALNGGIDIVVANAGIFPASQLIETIDDKDWARSLDVNLNGAFYLISESLRWLRIQGHGGDVVVIGTKNVPAPGKEAAAYSVAKAAETQLARVAALEAGAYGVRVNMLHPHLIFDTALWSESLIAERAKAYAMSAEQYKTNNLLKTELSSHDVAKACFALVGGYFNKTTGAQIPVDGGSDRTL
jgi:rhamnulose-1-phosphate aldolase/alcohol dehydrogenase